jgi:nicotinamidase/pyrazinamidase
MTNDTVFWDVDTQIDFMQLGGRLYVPEAETIVPNLQALVNAARNHDVFLVSSVCAHTLEDEEFRQWPPHCLRGTAGQLKIPETVIDGFYAIPNCAGAPIPEDVQRKYAQVILEKQELDIFTNPNTDGLLARIEPRASFVVFGVVTEYCVRLTALGLLKRGRSVAIVTDAIQTLRREDSERTIEEIANMGARFATTREVLTALESRRCPDVSG